MQDIIVEKPYTFIPPHRGSLLPWLILKSGLVRRHLRKAEGVMSCQLHGVDNLKESMRLGHGVLLAPNHCRYADPLVMSYVADEAKVLFYAMASWHATPVDWDQCYKTLYGRNLRMLVIS